MELKNVQAKGHKKKGNEVLKKTGKGEVVRQAK